MENVQHSNLIGGSNCAARMACPASWQMEQKLPASAREETSTYADEGSALHEAIANVLYSDLDAQELLGKVYIRWPDYPVTQDYIDAALKPCVEFFEQLDDEHGPLEFLIEKKVGIGSLPGLFGTCDLIARGPDRAVMIDWKFGVGEKVVARYADGRPNAQLMFYLLGAINTFPDMFRGVNEIVLCVAQPRYRDGPNFSQTVVTREELERFASDLTCAYRLLKSDDAPMVRGEHCRFMACKAICPLHTGPLLDIPDLMSLTTKAQLMASTQAEVAPSWDDTYALMMELAERIEPVLAEWRAQAQAHLEGGGSVPGWKLVEKRASRKWTKTDEQVERRLQRMGLSKNQRAPRTLISPPAAEKLLGKGNLPEGYYDAISSGLTIAKATDGRQDVKPVGDVAASLATALSAIRS